MPRCDRLPLRSSGMGVVGRWPTTTGPAGGRAGLLRRRAHAGDAGRRRPPAPAPAGPERAGAERGRSRRLQPSSEHPHGMTAATSTRWSPTGQSVSCLPQRVPVADPSADLPPTNHDNIHVRGYKEEGTTTTPFDMVMLNDLDRFHLVIDVVDRVPRRRGAGWVRNEMKACASEARRTREHGDALGDEPLRPGPLSEPCVRPGGQRRFGDPQAAGWSTGDEVVAVPISRRCGQFPPGDLARPRLRRSPRGRGRPPCRARWRSLTRRWC